MPEKTAYDFPQIYERLGMKLGHFGAIMLDVEPVPVSSLLDSDHDWFYTSKNPILRYVKGPVAETVAHVTLLYGLTPNDNAGRDQQLSVDELLTGLDLSSVTVESIGTFPPQYGESYQCVVAHLELDENLTEANRRLRFLPHIDTFLEYKAHVTLAYVKDEFADEAVSQLRGELEGQTLDAIGINYGGEIH